MLHEQATLVMFDLSHNSEPQAANANVRRRGEMLDIDHSRIVVVGNADIVIVVALFTFNASQSQATLSTQWCICIMQRIPAIQRDVVDEQCVTNARHDRIIDHRIGITIVDIIIVIIIVIIIITQLM